MKSALLATTLLLSATSATSAATVTYVFKGFVEHRPDAGPTEPADYGHIIPIRITVNTDAPGTISGDTEYYDGTGANDPIVSAQIGDATIPQSSYDSIVISQSSNGQPSITINSYAVQVGTYTFSFFGGVQSLSVPSKILTLQFTRSTFSSNYPNAFVAGDLTTAGIPPAKSSSAR